jgi:hypothetical protein
MFSFYDIPPNMYRYNKILICHKVTREGLAHLPYLLPLKFEECGAEVNIWTLKEGSDIWLKKTE